jgi:hypothetical protein
MANQNQRVDRAREWRSRLAILASGYLIFETVSGLSIWLLPFSVFNQVMVLLHTAVGWLFLIPCVWYMLRHWLLYRSNSMTHVKLLGYLGAGILIACAVSGVVLTWQAAFGTGIGYFWNRLHLITTLGVLAFIVPHVILALTQLIAASPEKVKPVIAAARRYGWGSAMLTVALLMLVALATYAYEPVPLKHEFDADYSFHYGEDRPFAPSLATTDTNKPFDSRSLSGSKSCGTAGCHVEITQEWEASAHAWAAMDVGFQKIQLTMAEQNGPESTRYCGGCHDPISLFSGTKNIFTDNEQLTSLSGFQEGVSCLACHAIRETDVKGNAHYVITEPPRYMFEIEYDEDPTETRRFLRDFLIRSYPRTHVESLSKRLFKTPEYCAACHKQFIDEEINSVGWVQLQNQYDNWRKSRWNHPGEADRTLECRECHMPLMDSADPASGDSADYNRTAKDGKHRSHRFLAANQFMPALLKVPGWEKQVELTEQWLKGDYPIPEIEHKWGAGPAVSVELLVPEEVAPGQKVEIKAVVTSNKVGHDFPTGPLDIIQSWIELIVRDDQGRELYASGVVDMEGFIQAGSFIFKAEPVDQYGNLIDRHNLWEMVGVRQRRALFPGFSDTAEFEFLCPDLRPVSHQKGRQNATDFAFEVPGKTGGQLHVSARLLYRKIDQSLLNFITGGKELTSPVTEMSSAQRKIRVSGS